MVDYIAVERADAAMLDGIAIGLAEGARQAGISISGGEIAQLRDVVRGFDLVGTAVGRCRSTGSSSAALGPATGSSGSPAMGSTATAIRWPAACCSIEAKLSVDDVVPELGCALGEELLRPTFIYVPEILELIERVPVSAR